MAHLLDSAKLDGPHAARISARPERIAVPLDASKQDAFRQAVEVECQVWGGAANALLPVTAEGEIPDYYRGVLPGSQIDRVVGAGHDPEMLLRDLQITGDPRDLSRSQLAVSLFEYQNQKKFPPLEVVRLEADDPWTDVYSACLGLLPDHPNAGLIYSGGWLPDLAFEDFLQVRRRDVEGSLADLISRLRPKEPMLTPRQVSMARLSYANTASSYIRTDKITLPDPGFARRDAGPNIVVVCTPGSNEDLALLWNLRAAHGDNYVTPLGIPSDAFTAEAIQEILSSPGVAHHGFAVSSLYVTSVSVDQEVLTQVLMGVSGVAVRPAVDLLMFGTVFGLSRDEILVWKEGRASYKPLDEASYYNVLGTRNVNDLLVMHYDVTLDSAPLPQSSDYRVDPYNGSFYNNAHTVWSSPRSGFSISTLQWPSRELVANSLAAIRGFKLRESAPGIAARIFIDMLGGLPEAHMLCHAPLLRLLEEMAARQGFPWYKAGLRRRGIEVSPIDAVGGSIDELPERSFHEFKRVLGNSDLASRYWLAWAERANVLIKGFPLQCPNCGAKQWIPVGNFSPPIVCRGCTVIIERPFGDRTSVDFKYRLSEQVRRVYESDGMGHILVARFFSFLFDFGSRSELIGLHPGMSVNPSNGGDELGEADLLMLTRGGDFVPIEVKRTASGFTPTELAKLSALAGTLKAPWSGVAACQYRSEVDLGMDESLALFNSDGSYDRVWLTYDQLLEEHPIWALGGDPFELRSMSRDEIDVREAAFVTMLVTRAKENQGDWLTYSMLRRRGDSAIDRGE